MKRSSHEVAGGPRNREVRPAVAGRPAQLRARTQRQSQPQSRGADVAYVRAGDTGPVSRVTTEEADLLADFSDFMSGEEELDLGLLPAPDATFEERLRRRLWRTFMMSYLRGGGETSH